MSAVQEIKVQVPLGSGETGSDWIWTQRALSAAGMNPNEVIDTDDWAQTVELNKADIVRHCEALIAYANQSSDLRGRIAKIVRKYAGVYMSEVVESNFKPCPYGEGLPALKEWRKDRDAEIEKATNAFVAEIKAGA